MALAENDLAILTARFGCARFGASRFGFIPCPEDVHGPSAEEPGEYIWKEVKPPTTAWQLITEDCVCGQAPVAGFTMSGVSVPPPVLTGDITGHTYLDAEMPGNIEPFVTVTIPALGLTTISSILGAFTFTGLDAGAVTLFGNKVGLIEGTNNGVVVAGGSVVINIVITSPV